MASCSSAYSGLVSQDIHASYALTATKGAMQQQQQIDEVNKDM
jgi:hypothetical protein